jgi:hypothetical protein
MTSRGSLNRLTVVGLCALAVANVLSFLLQRHSTLSEAVVDPVVGFAYGTAIALTLLGISRPSPCSQQ